MTIKTNIKNNTKNKTKKHTKNKTKKNNNNLLLKYSTNEFENKFGNLNINFKTYNKGLLPNYKTYNIFSVCYFIIENSDDLQKNKKYKQKMEQLIKDVQNYLPNYKFRIYCDTPAFNVINSYLKNPKVEIFVYDIEKFKSDTNKNYHKGYIGTILRYFPLFNLPEHTADLVVCFDVDNRLYYPINKIIQNYLPKLNFIGHSHSCYHTGNRYKYMGNLDYSIIGNLLAINTKKLQFPKYLLDEFFNDYLLKDNIHYNTYLKLYNIYNKDIPPELPEYLTQKYKRPHIKDDSIRKFIYGVDEYFINNQIRRYLLINKIPIFILPFSTQLKGTLLRLYTDIYLSNNMKLNKDFYKIFEEYFNILPLNIKHKNITDKSSIDDYLYNYNEITTMVVNKLQSLNNNDIINILNKHKLKNSTTLNKYNIMKKINTINKNLFKLVQVYFKDLNYHQHPEFFLCVKNGLLYDYTKNLNIIKYQYNNNNTSFIPYVIKSVSNSTLKKYNINKNKFIKYVNNPNFMKFDKNKYK